MTSKEGAIIANSLFLMAATGVVLLGTICPMLTEWLAGQKANVGAPYFNLAATPLIAAPLFLTPLATLLPWGAGRLMPVAQRLRIALVFTLAASAAVAALAIWGDIGAMIYVTLGVWLIAGALSDLLARRGETSRAARGQAWGAALAHAGVGVFALGAAISAALPTERIGVLAAGEALEVNGERYLLERVESLRGPNYIAARARVVAEERGLVLQPEQRFYPVAEVTTSEVGLHQSLIGDTYVALTSPQTRADGAEAWTLRVLINPMIWMVFVGPLMIALGALLAALSRPLGPVRESRA